MVKQWMVIAAIIKCKNCIEIFNFTASPANLLNYQIKNCTNYVECVVNALILCLYTLELSVHLFLKLHISVIANIQWSAVVKI